MTLDTAAGSDRPATLCRAAFDAPCRVEALVVAAPQVEDALRSLLAVDGRPPPLPAAMLCLAAVHGRVAAHDPMLASPSAAPGDAAEGATGSGCEVACSASAWVAARVGLGEALRLRFRGLAPRTGTTSELSLQADAERGLPAEEQTTLLRIAEEAVAQVTREGSPEVRIGLRRSRLGPVELSICGSGGVSAEREVAASYRSLALIRRLAARIEGRLSVRRMVDGALFVRCGTRWIEAATGQWPRPR